MFVRGSDPALKPILALLAGLALMIGTITAAQAQPSEEARPSSPQLEALARALGLSPDDAEQLLSVQVKLSGLAVDLETRLGAETSAGSWIDADSGKLVVAVTDAKAAERVRAAGAEPRTVKHSKAELAEKRKALDEFARAEGAGQAQSWGTDVKTNSLLIRTVAGAEDKATKAFLAKAEKLGVDVLIEQVKGTVKPAADLFGGQEVEMTGGYLCSAGFNAETAAGERIMLTAGHCAYDRPIFYRHGTAIGATRSVSFPENDFAAVDVSAAWTQRGAVDRYDGTYVELTGAGLGAVGSAVCKSGRTTQWTCGVISSHGATVNYGNGDIVAGLTQHTACLEQGDSGGANVSGSVAQGLTSGGMLYDRDGGLVCGEKVGQPNLGYFQPVEEALAANGATLITS